MKNKKKLKYIIAISAFALVGIVIIQISWIINAAELREAEFDHRVSMALFKTVDRLSSDQKFCADLKSQMNTNAVMAFGGSLGEEELAKIEKILGSRLRYYHVDLDFEYELVKYDKGFTKEELTALSSSFVNTPYKCSIEQIIGKSGFELRVNFPDKQKFVYAKMGGMLAASIIFITLIGACFVMTIKTIYKQKRIAEMTIDFINNMTHEFKTPLATISLANNMVRRDKRFSEADKIMRYSHIIHDENTRLQAQVERVLDLARLERGEFKLNKEKVDVHSIVKHAANTVELQVKERRGEINFDLQARNYTILADEVHVSNVVMNLLDNANKYSPESPKITVSTRDDKDGVVISVADKGIGMNKDKQKSVFDKFYRVPTGNVHNVKGFGLGLAYVKLMVDAHKGSIQLESELGKGSRFEIFLPNESVG